MYVKGRTFAALILRQDEELDKARDAVEEALTVEPENKNLILYRILLLRDQEEYDEAEEQVRTALKSDPEDERYLFNLALVLHDRGQRAEAADVMESVLKKNPANADALNYVAYELAEQNRDLPRAEELVRRAIQLRPNDGFYLDTLGWVQYKQGKIADAEQSLARAISASGDDLVIVEHYIEILLAQGKSNRAVAVMKAVVEQAPQSGQFDDDERAAAFKRIEERLKQLLQQHPELQSVEKSPLKRAASVPPQYSQIDFVILEEFER
jgi:tetratricopeptide (TPR) repeat protein